MKQYKFIHKAILGVITISLFTASLGGTFAVAHAAAYDAPSQEVKGMDSNVITEILTVGLIGLLSGHGGSTVEAGLPAKNAVMNPENSIPSVKPSAASPAAAGKTSTDPVLALNLLNSDRSKNGLHPLRFNSQLAALGQKYAKDMIQRRFFSHTDPEGLSPFDRMRKAGIAYSYAGENLAINRNVNSAENAFMNSSGHRANILSPNYTDVGIGVAYDARGSAYVVQEFISK